MFAKVYINMMKNIIADSHQLRHLSKRRWNYLGNRVNRWKKGMQVGQGKKSRKNIKMKIIKESLNMT